MTKISHRFFPDWKWRSTIKVFPSIEDRPLVFENVFVGRNHGFNDVVVHSAWTLVRCDRNVIMVNLPLWDANLIKVRPQSDRPTDLAKVRPLGKR